LWGRGTVARGPALGRSRVLCHVRGVKEWRVLVHHENCKNRIRGPVEGGQQVQDAGQQACRPADRLRRAALASVLFTSGPGGCGAAMRPFHPLIGQPRRRGSSKALVIIIWSTTRTALANMERRNASVVGCRSGQGACGTIRWSILDSIVPLLHTRDLFFPQV
jgi:hypothetical protein